MQVIVFTEWMGQSPNLVEDQVTYPISSALISAPKVQAVRGQSMFGMSFVNVIFDEGTDIYWARSRVLEYLSSVRAKLPQGVNPDPGTRRDGRRLGLRVRARRPDRQARPAGASLDPGLEPAVRARQRARRRRGRERRRLREAVPGQRRSDEAARIRHRRWTTSSRRCARPTRRSAAASSRWAATSRSSAGRGYVKDPEDIGRSPIRVVNGTPVRVRDVAQVSIGPDIRRGLSELNGEGEAPGGIVIMRYGENALDGHRRREGAAARDPAEPSEGRPDRPDLRPLAAHRGVGRHAQAHAHRRDDRRQRRSSSSSCSTRGAR